MNAFRDYLLRLPVVLAVEHVIDCLCHGGPDNEAWVMMEEFNHGWSCLPKDLPKLALETIVRMGNVKVHGNEFGARGGEK